MTDALLRHRLGNDRVRRCSYWDALPPIQGGKRRLAKRIFAALDRVVPRRHWSGMRFVDGFVGGGAIGLFAKTQDFDVTGVDIARRAYVTGVALLENSRTRLTELDVVRVLAARSDGPGLVSERWAPGAFTEPAGLLLDAILRTTEETADPHKAALLRLLATRMALCWHPMSHPRSGMAGRVSTGELEAITPTCVGSYLKQLGPSFEDQLRRMAARINRGVFPGRGRMIQADILSIVPDLEADILYADAPYAATSSYESVYEVIDDMLGDEARPRSVFSRRGGSAQLDVLLERAQHVPVVMISYGSAELSLEQLEEKLLRVGRVTRAMSIPYAHKVSVASAEKRAANREYLVIGIDPSTTLPLRLEGARGEVAV